MKETNFEAKVISDISLMTSDQAWATLNAMCDALTAPGWIEHQLEHSKFNGKIKAAKLNLFNALVTGTTICQGMTDEAASVVSKSIHEIQTCYASYVQILLDQTSLAIQSLSPEELFQEARLHEGDFDESALEGMSESARESIMAQQQAYKSIGAGEGTTAMVKPCEQIQVMFAVAAAMLGGRDKLAVMQAEITRTLPEEFRKNVVAVMAAQATGAIAQALQLRIARDDFSTATIVGVSEMYLNFERSATLAFLPMWEDGAGDVFGRVLDQADGRMDEMLKSDSAGPLTDADLERAQFSREAEAGAEQFVQKAESLNLKPQSAPLEADKPDNMKATSTLFAGTRTIN